MARPGVAKSTLSVAVTSRVAAVTVKQAREMAAATRAFMSCASGEQLSAEALLPMDLCFEKQRGHNSPAREASWASVENL
jgi:hypothetical protein